MKLSESFRLLGTSTVGDSDSKYDRYRPRLDRDGAIAFGEVDGGRIESVSARGVLQWVTTLEDNDDLTYALLSAGKRRLRSTGARSTMYITDARVVFVQDKANPPGQRVVGHVRFPWVDAIVWRTGKARFTRPALQIWMHEDFPVKHLGSWHHYIEVELQDPAAPGMIALDLARRVSAHNLAHGAPTWIHDRLREQAQITELPQPDDKGEGLWECPASVACPYGAEYIGDSPDTAEWIGRGAQAPAADPSTAAGGQQRAPSTVILKRMLARGRSIARERGNAVVGTDDLLLAVLIDDGTAVGQLMARHGAAYDSVKSQLDASRSRQAPQTENALRPRRIAVGKQKLRFSLALGLMRAMRDIGRSEEAEDHAASLECGNELMALADRSGISTLRALAHVQLGDSYLALGRLNEASNAFGSAAALCGAPTITWSALAPRLDPVEIVDEALHGLWRVADKRNSADKSAEIVALEQLREFRVRHGSSESKAWVADQLARVHGLNDDFAAAARWGAIAAEEYERSGKTAEAANAAGIVAESFNKAGEPARALPAAQRAVEGAAQAGDRDLEAVVRFQLARAYKALGDTASAWAEFSALLPDAPRRSPATARAIVINMAEIDTASAAADAIALADLDVVFYGPRSAEIAVAAARLADADDPDAARQLLIHSVRIAVGVLSHPDTVPENVDRAFVTLGEALTATADPNFTQEAVQLLEGPLRLLDPERFRASKCLVFLETLDAADRFELLVAIASPIVARLAETAAAEPEPAIRDLVALVRRQWELIRGLNRSGDPAAALHVQEELIGWMRKAAALAPGERSRLGFHLAAYGNNLMWAKRFAEAHDAQAEAIELLRAGLSTGVDCRRALVLALQVHARLADETGDRAQHRARLQEALTLLNGTATDWVETARSEIHAALASADGT